MQNIEISRFDLQNSEISRFDMHIILKFQHLSLHAEY